MCRPLTIERLDLWETRSPAHVLVSNLTEICHKEGVLSIGETFIGATECLSNDGTHMFTWVSDKKRWERRDADVWDRSPVIELGEKWWKFGLGDGKCRKRLSGVDGVIPAKTGGFFEIKGD